MQLDINYLEDCVIALGLDSEGAIKSVEAYEEYSSLLVITLDSPLNCLNPAGSASFEECLNSNNTNLYRHVSFEEYTITNINQYFPVFKNLRELLEPDPKSSKYLRLKSTYDKYSTFRKRGISSIGNLFLNLKTKIPSNITNEQLKIFSILTNNPAALNCYVIGENASDTWSNLLGPGMQGVRRLVGDMFGILYDEATIDAPLPFIVLECATLDEYLAIRFCNEYQGALERSCYAVVVDAMYHLMNSKLEWWIPIVKFDNVLGYKINGTPVIENELRDSYHKQSMYRSWIYRSILISDDGRTMCPYDMYTLFRFLDWSKGVATNIFGEEYNRLEESENYVFSPYRLEDYSDQKGGIWVKSWYASTIGNMFPTVRVNTKTNKVIINDGEVLYHQLFKTVNKDLRINATGIGTIEALVEESKSMRLKYTRDKMSSYISSASTWLYKVSRDCLKFPTASEYPKRTQSAKLFYHYMRVCEDINLVRFRKFIATGLYHILNESFWYRIQHLDEYGLRHTSSFRQLFDSLFMATKPKFHANIFNSISNINSTTLYVNSLDRAAWQLAVKDLSDGGNGYLNHSSRLELLWPDTKITCSSNPTIQTSIYELYLRGLRLLHDSVLRLQKEGESAWLTNFDQIEVVLRAGDHTSEIFKILNLGSGLKETMNGLSVFSSSNVPKHLKLFSYITDTLRISINTDPITGKKSDSSTINIKIRMFLRVCEILEEYGTAIKLVSTLETMLHGLLDAEVPHKTRYYILGTITRLDAYLKLLTNLRDRD